MTRNLMENNTSVNINEGNRDRFNEINDEKVRDLVARAKNGDEKALDELALFSYRKLYPYVFYRFKQREDAEEITGSIVLKMARSLKGQTGNFMAWLYKIASNTIIDQYRKGSRPSELSLDQLPYEIRDAKEKDPRNSTDDIFRRERLKEALRHLTTEQADVITHRFIMEDSIEETARLMSKSIGAVKLLQFRGLRALKDYFRKKGYDIEK